ncbi:MAG: TraR/DksA family transcriptional regulator [Candidatus Auribacterota bacterium]|jgi:RNA polymerase-binding protein DksA|nr:TraR/DksA family transcriptional regulator [Candidatus Auribacterota bacterium]
MTPEQLQEFKEKLLALKERILGDLEHLKGDALRNSFRDSAGDLSGYSLHMADQGTDNFDREFTFDLYSNEQDIIYMIDDALERIEEGNYDQCRECPSKISLNRLEAIPYTMLCIDCANKFERKRHR